MTKYYRCRCAKVRVVPDDTQPKCLVCGDLGEEIPADYIKEGFERGTYFNIDPRTGKRAKSSRGKR